jgi:hypothetical protein
VGTAVSLEVYAFYPTDDDSHVKVHLLVWSQGIGSAESAVESWGQWANKLFMSGKQRRYIDVDMRTHV